MSYGPFPAHILRELSEYPGNQKCCDCPSLDTDWASINHGTLVCLDCAGKHRSLGVHVSFVRSIFMDTWSPQQVEMMRQGGNGQIRDFFKKLQIENSPITTLYCTKGAAHYRERLKERVDKIVAGEIPGGRRAFPQKHTHSTHPSTQHHSNSNTHPETTANTSTATPRKGKRKEQTNHTTEYINVTFVDGPMGMTVTKDHRDLAHVTRVVQECQAQKKGVVIADQVVGVAGKAMTDYDEIMNMISCMGRPVQITFQRTVVGAPSTPAATTTSTATGTTTSTTGTSAAAAGGGAADGVQTHKKTKSPSKRSPRSNGSSRHNSGSNYEDEAAKAVVVVRSPEHHNGGTHDKRTPRGTPRTPRAPSRDIGDQHHSLTASSPVISGGIASLSSESRDDGEYLHQTPRGLYKKNSSSSIKKGSRSSSRGGDRGEKSRNTVSTLGAGVEEGGGGARDVGDLDLEDSTIIDHLHRKASAGSMLSTILEEQSSSASKSHSQSADAYDIADRENTNEKSSKKKRKEKKKDRETVTEDGVAEEGEKKEKDKEKKGKKKTASQPADDDVDEKFTDCGVLDISQGEAPSSILESSATSFSTVSSSASINADVATAVAELHMDEEQQQQQQQVKQALSAPSHDSIELPLPSSSSSSSSQSSAPLQIQLKEQQHDLYHDDDQNDDQKPQAQPMEQQEDEQGNEGEPVVAPAPVTLSPAGAGAVTTVSADGHDNTRDTDTAAVATAVTSSSTNEDCLQLKSTTSISSSTSIIPEGSSTVAVVHRNTVDDVSSNNDTGGSSTTTVYSGSAVEVLTGDREDDDGVSEPEPMTTVKPPEVNHESIDELTDTTTAATTTATIAATTTTVAGAIAATTATTTTAAASEKPVAVNRVPAISNTPTITTASTSDEQVTASVEGETALSSSSSSSSSLFVAGRGGSLGDRLNLRVVVPDIINITSVVDQEVVSYLGIKAALTGGDSTAASGGDAADGVAQEFSDDNVLVPPVALLAAGGAEKDEIGKGGGGLGLEMIEISDDSLSVTRGEHSLGEGSEEEESSAEEEGYDDEDSDNSDDSDSDGSEEGAEEDNSKQDEEYEDSDSGPEQSSYSGSSEGGEEEEERGGRVKDRSDDGDEEADGLPRDQDDNGLPSEEVQGWSTGDGDDDDDDEEEEEERGGGGRGGGRSRSRWGSVRICIEPGMLVKVLTRDKWRSAVIKKEHHDGTYKVVYRDASTESHVPPVRLAVPRTALHAEAANKIDDTLLSEAAAAAVIGGGGSIDDGDLTNIVDMDVAPSRDTYNYLRKNSAARYYEPTADEEEEGAAEDFEDFVVTEEDGMDGWIDEDDSEQISELIAKNQRQVREEKLRLQRSESRDAGYPSAVVVDTTSSSSSSSAAGGGWTAAGSTITDGLPATQSQSTVLPPTSPGAAIAPPQGRDFRVTFPTKPLGLTLSKNTSNGSAEVTKVVLSGQADLLGVVVGDRLVGFGNLWVHGYDEAMSLLPNQEYPLTLVFRRGLFHSLSQTGKVLTDKLLGPLTHKQSILVAPKNPKLSSRHADRRFNLPVYTENSSQSHPQSTVSSYTSPRASSSASASAPFSSASASASGAGSSSTAGRGSVSTATAGGGGGGVEPLYISAAAAKMTTRKELDGSVDDTEFDVVYRDGELGARFDERDGATPVTVITNVVPNGQSHKQGISVGCVVVGINGERYISHAHTFATLKHSKRPITVRFKKS